MTPTTKAGRAFLDPDLSHWDGDADMEWLAAKVVAIEREAAAEAEALRAALEGLTSHWDAMAGQRAHHLGCGCSGSPDGKHSCATLSGAFRLARIIRSVDPRHDLGAAALADAILAALATPAASPRCPVLSDEGFGCGGDIGHDGFHLWPTALATPAPAAPVDYLSCCPGEHSYDEACLATPAPAAPAEPER